MKCYAVYSAGDWAWAILGEFRVQAFAAADSSRDKLAALGMDAYASMGFLAGGVELQSVRDATGKVVKPLVSMGRPHDEDILRGWAPEVPAMKTIASMGRPGNEAPLRGWAPEAPGLAGAGYPHVLISFVYDKDGSFFEEKLRYWPTNCLGDSGAFTVWTKGDVIDLEDYAAWARAYLAKKPDFRFLNLDVIPGDFATMREPTAKEREASMAASLENADALRGLGVPVMEVYHLHEPLSYMEQLIERRQPGVPIAFGGLAGRGTPASVRRYFCDQAFARIRDLCGGLDKLIPVHGLGISPSINIASEFPWYSVDSSTWASPARFGKHVSRAGKATGLDSRVSNRDIRRLYLTRMLEGWNKREHVLTEMWARRGVRFVE